MLFEFVNSDIGLKTLNPDLTALIEKLIILFRHLLL